MIRAWMCGKSPGTGRSTTWYELLLPDQLEMRYGSRDPTSKDSRCAGSFRRSRATPFIGATSFPRMAGSPGACKRNLRRTGWRRKSAQDQERFQMARKQARPKASRQVTLQPHQIICRGCGSRMRMGHHSHRTVTTLQGVTRLILKVYRCRNTACSRFHLPTRPEEEGRWA